MLSVRLVFYVMRSCIGLPASGTIPAAQGKGLCGAILREITAKADKQDLPCYIEASSEGSKRLYQRHGFEVFDTYPVAPHVTIFIMARPRRSSIQDEE